MKKTYSQSVDQNGSTAIKGARVAIVQGAWHKEHSDRMVATSTDLLKAAGCDEVDLYLVPGVYEIPLTSKKLAKTGRYDAIIVYGIIVKGDTDHYEVLLQTNIRELGRVMYEFEVPIIMEILPVFKIEDAIARTMGDGNKGIEAAQATIEIIALYRSLALQY